ncbi:MAG: aquaporin family protein [Actinomycetota bacterium]|nr:aquaporin family protein [Actinomycetota bacterium]
MVDDHLVATERADIAEGTGEAGLGRRLLAEFVGTLLFVAVGTGAATVLALGPLKVLQGLSDILPPGDPTAQRQFGALIGNNPGDLLMVAFAFATSLAVLVYAFGGVSGAHFNPAVTFALAVSRRFRWRDVVPYWVVQCLGAIAGAFVVAGIYGKTGAHLGGTDILFGATTVATETIYQAILAEAFIAFVLMTAIMGIAVDHRAPKGWSGLVIGFGLAGGILVTASATGGSANFARSLGPFVASLVIHPDSPALNIPWSDLIVYAAGPLIGASAAALVYESVTGLELASPAPSPGAATGEHEGQHLEEAVTLDAATSDPGLSSGRDPEPPAPRL